MKTLSDPERKRVNLTPVTTTVAALAALPAPASATLIAEIPSPECAGACASDLARRYRQARVAFEQLLERSNPAGKPLVVRVTGVGFFDRPHNQLGAAPNCIELHPVFALTSR